MQRTRGQEVGEPSRPDEAGVGYHDSGQDGAHEEPTSEHVVLGQAGRRARGHPEHGERGGGQGAGDVERASCPGTGLRPRRGNEGDGGTGHEVEEPGVGAVVDA